MAKINLIPEVKQEKLKIQKVNTIVTSIATIVGIGLLSVSLIILFLITAKKVEIGGITKETTSINEELKKYQNLEAKVISLEEGLKKINTVLSGKKDWTKFFAQLEKATPNDIQITSISVNNGAINMSVNGRQVKSVDRFIKSFSTYKFENNTLFSAVSVDGFTKNDKGMVSFGAKMNFNEGLLW